jgi:hypothetical protein
MNTTYYEISYCDVSDTSSIIMTDLYLASVDSNNEFSVSVNSTSFTFPDSVGLVTEVKDDITGITQYMNGTPLSRD